MYRSVGESAMLEECGAGAPKQAVQSSLVKSISNPVKLAWTDG